MERIRHLHSTSQYSSDLDCLQTRVESGNQFDNVGNVLIVQDLFSGYLFQTALCDDRVHQCVLHAGQYNDHGSVYLQEEDYAFLQSFQPTI